MWGVMIMSKLVPPNTCTEEVLGVCCSLGNHHADCGNMEAWGGANTRTFTTGATRDGEEGKLEISGFLSPLVVKRFGEYMHGHRKLVDDTLRSSRNWRKGIPKEVYEESLIRHALDVWLHMDGFEGEANEPLEVALCGILFNASGLLHELLLERKELGRGRVE